MSVQARLEAAMDGETYELDPSGDRTVDVEIPSNGLSKDEVRDHEAVEDLFEADDSTFKVYVSASTNIHFSVT